MGGDHPRVFVPPPIIFAVLTGGGLAWQANFSDFGFLQALGILLAAAGLALIGPALNLFRLRGTRPEPWQPASELVLSGIYRLTRNPMYLGMTLVSFALATFAVSIPAAALSAVAALVIDRYVIPREEAYLLRRFGDNYASYMRQVRRWL
jgi:protein-S-isoprenylcysteine O-methyltransferase Ste14